MFVFIVKVMWEIFKKFQRSDGTGFRYAILGEFLGRDIRL